MRVGVVVCFQTVYEFENYVRLCFCDRCEFVTAQPLAKNFEVK